MDVCFWGTRGSLAKPGPSTIRYGGNTSCVEVRTDDDTLLILDCGTGAHDLAQELVRTRKGPLKGSILISHTHWDHIQGIPFFGPLFTPGNEWDIYAPQGFGETLKSTLAGQMEYTFFPVTPEAFGATIRYHNVNEGSFDIGDIRVTTRFLNHPALTVGYRIEADDAVLVYACDHEPHAHDAALSGGELTGQDKAHSDFLRGASLVIHDAQYSAAEYPAKAGWGHSSVEYAAAVCKAAKVQQLALTHHDPLRDDAAVDELLARARESLDGADRPDIFAAAEGLRLRVKDAEREETAPSPKADEVPAKARSNTLIAVVHSDELFDLIKQAAGDEGLGVQRAVAPSELQSLDPSTLPPMIVVEDSLAKDTLAQARKLCPDIPVLIVGDASACPADPAAEHLPGTISRQFLRSRLRTWLMRGKYSYLPAAIPENEASRLAKLRSIQILDTPPEERFDKLTRIAAKLFNAPISLISLVDEDRQWFKSKVGLTVSETPRHVSFCGHAIAQRAPLVVPDALQDQRFAGNPLVTGGPRVRFYAGVPVHVEDEAVGTLCLIDTKPRDPSGDELQLLEDLASLVQAELARPQ